MIDQRLLGRDSEDVLGAFKGLRWEGVVVDEAVKKFSVRDVIGRVSRCWGDAAVDQRLVQPQHVEDVAQRAASWRPCGGQKRCKRATRVVVGAGQPLRRAQGLHLGLQGVRRRLPRSCIMAKRRSSAAHGSSCRALCFLGRTRMIGELQIQRPLLYWARARRPSTSIAATISPIAIRKSSSPSPSLSLQR